MLILAREDHLSRTVARQVLTRNEGNAHASRDDYRNRTHDNGQGTPLSLAARIFLLYNQSEGKAYRTQEWYRV
jgi:hypothetical protein